MTTSSGCPRCGADRMKSAPIFVVDSVARVTLRRRRYRCGACGWIGWRRRLRRRVSEVPTLTPRQGPTRRAAAVSLFAAAFLIVSGLLLIRGCNAGPRPPIENVGQE